MQIEALPPDGGVARASVNGIEHFRLRDVAGAVPGLQADPRWPSVSFADTAARMFVQSSGIDGVMIHRLPKRGRYVPRDQFRPAFDYFTSSATIAEAQDRTWASINANRKRTKAVPEIVIEETSGRSSKIRYLTAADLARPIEFVVTADGLFFRLSDLTLSVTQARSAGPFHRWYSDHKARMHHGAYTSGRASVYLPDDLVEAMFERLSARADYDRAMAGRVIRHITTLRTRLAGEISSAALGAVDPVQIVAQTMGAGAEALPPVEVEEAERMRREHGHLWTEHTPEARAEKLEELKQVQFEPPADNRRKTADALLERMGRVDRSQEALIERIDAVLAQKDAAIAARDRQIAALQELVIDLGKNCVSLLGSIAELKAIATR